MSTAPTLDRSARHQAIVVAGGRAARLGGIDKCALESFGQSLLERAIGASASARTTVVVGRGGPSAVAATRLRSVDERPRFGGPVAAIAAGLAALDGDPMTLVLAADLPKVGSAVPLVLSAFADGRLPSVVDGVIAMDETGRPQPLLGLYRTTSLRRAVDLLPTVDGASMRSLLSPLVLATIAVPDAFCSDVDTPEDVRRHDLAAPGSTATGGTRRVA